MADEKTAKLARRFYTDVRVAGVEGGYQVHLDGRPVKTPHKAALAVLSRELAELIAAEWDAQAEKIDPMSMPMTQIACTALDRVGDNRDEIRTLIAKYGETDLLCYRADGPADLVEKQQDVWQPILDWAENELGIKVDVTTSIIPVSQDMHVLALIKNEVAALDDHELAAVSIITQATGSVIIALAVAHGYLTADGAVDASQLDESYQSALWGADREAEQRLRALRSDINAAAQYMSLHRAR